jgi:diaminopimelate decarboxylase
MNQKDCLIQGISPLALCETYGTPLYVYDTQIIENQYKILTNAFSSVKNLRINYACKALTNLTILKFLKQMGSCVDTVSIQEVYLCLLAGFEPQQIGYTPSGVAFEEIIQAVDLGVKIHLDSLPLMRRFGAMYRSTYPVGIRINPHVMGGGNLKISTGHVRSKFGISIEQLADIQQIMKETGLVIEGLHQHTGSDIKEADTFLQVAEIMLETALKFPDLKWMDFGGGFKVPYKPDEKGADMEKLGRKIGARFNTFCQKYGRDLTLVFEPGKFLVSQSGVFLVKVNVVKHNPNISFAGVDSGLNHLIRPMMYDAYHHILNLSNPKGVLKKYNVVGYLCETDNFAEDRMLPEISEGDILCLLNAGAYGITMASNYNGRYRPAEVMIHQGKDYLVRRREDMEYILQNQVQSVNFETNGQIESEVNELDPALRADGKLYREFAENGSI